ncbi:CBS domain-containing protein [Legionella oakridgensis]|uniref:CBS domain protein n=2 Tax=Legionella oakridgensis TaxID=29423 RepID=A0A0W0XG14_9GAMM|nr:CBS domain-containing protein [Legionella oakridgensis]AHE67473.1 putative signal-transduction protein containing cAMP-binding and CBS domains [Legionella oakridgensis ATCC 33761 = DSM 21215]ETO93003.1 putative signal-transduction protein [Legionella oakridgensis RV-2-2007]KTD43531.1 CBS domain protein [Legionella oakridgensis]STY20523.1 CBS domain protein [Legionella longbeachae]
MSQLLHSILPQPRRPIVYIHPDVSVAQCVELMIQDNIGALVVTDDENLLGMVSERDIVRSLVHKGLAPQSTKVSDILHANVSVLQITDTVEKAMEVITMTKRRHILVAEEGQLVALVSIGDLLFSLLEDKARVIEELQNYIHTY